MFHICLKYLSRPTKTLSILHTNDVKQFVLKNRKCFGITNGCAQMVVCQVCPWHYTYHPEMLRRLTAKIYLSQLYNTSWYISTRTRISIIYCYGETYDHDLTNNYSDLTNDSCTACFVIIKLKSIHVYTFINLPAIRKVLKKKRKNLYSNEVHLLLQYVHTYS